MSLIEVKNATFGYEKHKKIFKDINLTLEEGQIFSIVGPNGCGKTTLLDNILGIHKLDGGDIFIGSKNLKEIKERELAEKVAYIPQSHTTTFPYKVIDIVTMGRTYNTRMFSSPGEENIREAKAALELVGIPHFEDRDYTTLSGGELQLVIIARAVAQGAKILIMDEPTAHLDFTHEIVVLETIEKLVKEKNLSVIMATHMINHPVYFENKGIDSRVAIMKDGSFYKMGPASQVLEAGNLEKAFNIVVDICQGKEGQKYIMPLHRI